MSAASWKTKLEVHCAPSVYVMTPGWTVAEEAGAQVGAAETAAAGASAAATRTQTSTARRRCMSIQPPAEDVRRRRPQPAQTAIASLSFAYPGLRRAEPPIFGRHSALLHRPVDLGGERRQDHRGEGGDPRGDGERGLHRVADGAPGRREDRAECRGARRAAERAEERGRRRGDADPRAL